MDRLETCYKIYRIYLLKNLYSSMDRLETDKALPNTTITFYFIFQYG